MFGNDSFIGNDQRSTIFFSDRMATKDFSFFRWCKWNDSVTILICTKLAQLNFGIHKNVSAETERQRGLYSVQCTHLVSSTFDVIFRPHRSSFPVPTTLEKKILVRAFIIYLLLPITRNADLAC